MITTVIPTFERPEMLRRAVLSVLAQDVPDLEVRIYDNASGDDTASVAQELMRLDNRVAYCRHNRNLGSIANFNFALSEISSRYFSVLSDDDILLPGFLPRALAALEGSASSGFWCGRTVTYDSKSESVWLPPAWEPGFYRGGEHSMRRMIRQHYTWTGVLWRQRVLETVPGLDAVGSDDNFIVRAALTHDFLVSPLLTAVLFLHSAGWTGSMLEGTAVADRDRLSEYLTHVIERPRELQKNLRADSRVRPETANRACRALDVELRHDLLAHFLC
ncbi:MAG: glycosyltransferase family 2 protein, partial [Fimbriimonadales bacterium]